MKYSCRILVKGHLGRERSRFLDGWKMVPQRDGTTLLEGASIDDVIAGFAGKAAATATGICPLRLSEAPALIRHLWACSGTMPT